MEKETPPPATRCLRLRLSGGLGNQLFQWCAGDRVAKALGLDLRVDPTYYLNDPYGREALIVELLSLKVEGPTVTGGGQYERTITDHPDNCELIARLPSTAKGPARGESLALQGYWQDNRIPTNDQLAYLADRLRGRIPSSGVAKAVVKSAFPVAVHIRRHDYLHHGVCDPNYYLDAALGVYEVFPDSFFWVFGDEPNFSRWLFSSSGVPHHVVDTGGAVSDLGLMVTCKAHITSNSTFSWWGARLSASAHIIVPSPWSFAHQPSEHLVPKDWLVIPGAVSEFKRKSKCVDLVISRLRSTS